MGSMKSLGIWMDHSIAHIVEFTDDQVGTNTIYAKIGEQDEPLNSQDESLIQNKEQNQLSDYFNRLSEVIKEYEEVILFGPTGAKNELLNLLENDRHFEKIKFTIKTSENMTENQRHAYVIEHFNSSE